jgi:hypothetical protein
MGGSPEEISGLTRDDSKSAGDAAMAVRRVQDDRIDRLAGAQSRGLDQTLTKAGDQLNDPAATLARGKTRRDTAAVTDQITGILTNPWAARVITGRAATEPWMTMGNV